MFQTAINHYLQSFATEELTSFMRFITTLGYPTFLMVFLLVLLYAVDFKKGFLLFLVLLWTALITFFFKDYFDLPRPFHVDNTLAFLDGQLPDEASFEFSERDAPSFWASLPADVLEITRQAEGVQNGFPSGHASCAIAFWGALGLLFRKRWITIIVTSLMFLIPLSRMYLGVHFLADVVGGVALGGIILGIFYALVLKPNKLNTFSQKNHYDIGINTISFILLICPFVGFLFLPPKYYILVAYMVGFGLSFLLLARKGLPINEAPLSHILGRTIIGVFIFIIFNYILKMISDQMGLSENLWVDFFRNLIGSLALMWIGIEIGIRLGWFKRGDKVKV